jgi:Adenylate and Guanylate cyclase catalytic domain
MTDILFFFVFVVFPLFNIFTNKIYCLNPCLSQLTDIAGFTEWSSKREPNDVFVLLETIYGSFDAIALRRIVFKIETIGDCYVAVTGLPTPQPDHAIIMTRFAIEMLETLQSDLKTTIAPELGDDSLTLAMRVGIHSGPVIAGVLRGNKARYQLFGDTMNTGTTYVIYHLTVHYAKPDICHFFALLSYEPIIVYFSTAARMESNGQRNCIHMSQATANLLTEAGKRHWIYPRVDLVNAKGKGTMQTYWVNLGGSIKHYYTQQSIEKPSSLCSI